MSSIPRNSGEARLAGHRDELSIEDTGQRRRVIDMVSKDDALELVCTLAYESALKGGKAAVIAQIERSILKLRSL